MYLYICPSVFQELYCVTKQASDPKICTPVTGSGWWLPVIFNLFPDSLLMIILSFGRFASQPEAFSLKHTDVIRVYDAKA